MTGAGPGFVAKRRPAGRCDDREVTDQQRPRRRRVVRPAGTVGGDEANLRSSFPAPPPDDASWGRPSAADSSPDQPGTVRRAPDDEDIGWGRPVSDSNDDRLTRDRPPHW
jgi:hypothetical protein